MTMALQELWQLSRSVAETHDVGIVLQLFDRTGPRHNVTTVLDHRVPPESIEKFRDGVFEFDPFTHADFIETLPQQDGQKILRSDNPEIAKRRKASAVYWSFIDHFGFTVEGVAIRRLRPGICMTAGFLGQKARRKPRDPMVSAHLRDIGASMHMLMSAHLLEQTLQSNVGLMGLQYATQGPGTEGSADATGRMAQLSPREADVARLVALGMQTKNVAHKLGLSDHTVVNHLRNIYTKLGVHRRAELARLVC